MEPTKKTLDYYKRLPYTLKLDLVKESDNSTYWTAEYTELRGCKADGDIEAEAVANLQELFDDFILAQLEADANIPEPAPLVDTVNETVIILGFRKPLPPANATVEEVQVTKETKPAVKYQEIEDTVPI